MKLSVALFIVSCMASVVGHAQSLQFDLTNVVDAQVYLSGYRCSDISDAREGSADLEGSSTERYSLSLNPSQVQNLKRAGSSAFVQVDLTVKAEVSTQVYDAESSIDLSLFANTSRGWVLVDSFNVTATRGNNESDAYVFTGPIPFGTTALRVMASNSAFVDCGSSTSVAQGSTGVVVSIDRASVWW